MKFRYINDFLLEDWTKEKDLKLIPKKDLFGLKLFFISKNSKLKKLSPRMLASAAQSQENDIVDRVCFAPSIESCLLAIGDENTDYYVYIPDDSLANHDIYKCSTHEVMDAYSTDEYWCLDDIKIKKIYKIHTKKWVSVNSELLQGQMNYEIVETYDEFDPDNLQHDIIKEFALCNDFKFEDYKFNDYMSWLIFKDESDAKKFEKLCKKELQESHTLREGNFVYYLNTYFMQIMYNIFTEDSEGTK